MRESLAVVTALIGDRIRDRVRLPRMVPAGVDFLLYSDRPLHGVKRGPWQLRRPVWQHLRSTRRTARFHKVCLPTFLPSYTHWLWLDGCLELLVDPWHIVNCVHDASLAAFRHPQRDCIYKEYDACVRFRKDDAELMSQQIAYYRYLGYPLNRGLAETALLLRRNEPKIVELSNLWWEHITYYSSRDQISFPFAAWRVGQSWAEIPGSRDRSAFCKFHFHVHHGDKN